LVLFGTLKERIEGRVGVFVTLSVSQFF